MTFRVDPEHVGPHRPADCYDVVTGDGHPVIGSITHAEATTIAAALNEQSAEQREQIAREFAANADWIRAEAIKLAQASAYSLVDAKTALTLIATALTLNASTPTTSEAPVMGGGVSELTDEQLAEKVQAAMQERLSWASLHWPSIPPDALTILAAVATETLLAAVRRQRNTQEPTA